LVRAYSQLINAVLMFPRCNKPVGLGANLVTVVI
jgi:hypothetical protein